MYICEISTYIEEIRDVVVRKLEAFLWKFDNGAFGWRHDREEEVVKVFECCYNNLVALLLLF